MCHLQGTIKEDTCVVNAHILERIDNCKNFSQQINRLQDIK